MHYIEKALGLKLLLYGVFGIFSISGSHLPVLMLFTGSIELKYKIMAQIDVEKKRNNKNNNSNWWIIAVIVIIAIIVAWIALSDRNRADVDIPPEPVVLKDRTGTRQYL